MTVLVINRIAVIISFLDRNLIGPYFKLYTFVLLVQVCSFECQDSAPATICIAMLAGCVDHRYSVVLIVVAGLYADHAFKCNTFVIPKERCASFKINYRQIGCMPADLGTFLRIFG